MTRLEVAKTYKLFIDGKFPRSESGRTIPVSLGRGKARETVHVCRASRKDLREAVVAARKGLDAWSAATAYLRGQILYRMAEMLEGKRDEFVSLLESTPAANLKPAVEVAAAIDRLIAFAGWADKYAQVLGCNNPVAGPYYNFTTPEPTGVVAVVAPDSPALLGLISLIAPPLCAGNAVIALCGESNPVVGAVLGEVLATSDLPAGAVNILTGLREELVPVIASHRDIEAVLAFAGPGGLSAAEATTLREGAAENVKRIAIVGEGGKAKPGSKKPAAPDWLDASTWESPWTIEPMVEMKTVWHPSGA